MAERWLYMRHAALSSRYTWRGLLPGSDPSAAQTPLPPIVGRLLFTNPELLLPLKTKNPLLPGDFSPLSQNLTFVLPILVLPLMGLHKYALLGMLSLP